MAFKIAPTTAGTDALIEAQEGLRPAFSIEASADQYTIDKGVMKVSKATLTGVAHVTNPAFKAAQITEVAASEEEEQTTEAEEAAEELTEETTVEENKETAVAEEVVAEATPVQASAPVAYTKPRSPIVNGASYLEHSIKAAAGNEDSRIYVRAADDSTSTNTGLTLPSHMSEFVTNTISDRPAVAAVSRQALVSTGMSFTVPKLGDAPTVAATGEDVAPSSTGMTSAYETVTLARYAGQQTIDLALLERSDPIFFDQLAIQLERAYKLATDNAMIAALTAGGTQATGVAATNAGLISFVSTESAAAYAGSSYFAENLVVNPTWWSTIMGYTDTTGRPIYNASQPWNAAGDSKPTSIKGNVLGRSEEHTSELQSH